MARNNFTAKEITSWQKKKTHGKRMQQAMKIIQRKQRFVLAINKTLLVLRKSYATSRKNVNSILNRNIT